MFDINYDRERYKRPFDDLLVGKKELVGAEIGVYCGQHAREMLEKLDIKKLYLVDIWRKYDGYQLKHNVANPYSVAEKLLRPFNSKLVWIKKFSTDAVKMFEDNSLDFVYIDVNHEYYYFYQDIEIWPPKVKSGGYVGGHDYRGIHGGLDFKGVRKAVNDYCEKNNINFDTKDGTTSVDWFFKKGFKNEVGD